MEIVSSNKNTLAFRIDASWTAIGVLSVMYADHELLGKSYTWGCNVYLMNMVSEKPRLCSDWTTAQKQMCAAVFSAFMIACGDGGQSYNLHAGNRLSGYKRLTLEEIEIHEIAMVDISSTINEEQNGQGRTEEIPAEVPQRNGASYPQQGG